MRQDNMLTLLAENEDLFNGYYNKEEHLFSCLACMLGTGHMCDANANDMTSPWPLIFSATSHLSELGVTSK